MTVSARDRFWGHAAAFGAMWGALEAVVGSFLHAVKIPFGGAMLAAAGATMLIALRTVHPRRGVVLAAGLVCAGVKLLSPATIRLGPMTGIMMEALLIELACVVVGANHVTAALGGALAALWALTQKVLVQIVLYGGPMLDLYREILARAEQWLALPRSGGVWVVAPFAALVALLGASMGIAGHRAALAVRARRLA